MLGFNISNTLSLMIYKKSLVHPLITEKEFGVSDIINFSQVDAQRMTYMGYQLVALIFTPFQVVVGLYLLYSYIGVATFVGLGVMILMMLFTLAFTKVAASANDELLKAKDGRMKVTEEIIQIIKFIKINALEKFFFQKLNRKRETELKYIRKVNMLYVLVIFVYWLCPPAIVSFTFLVFINTGGEITAAKAFITIIIFNLLQYPIRLLPTAISELIQMWSSVKRIENYFEAIEIKRDCIEYNEARDEEHAVTIKRGTFLWGKEKEKEEDKDKDKEKENKKEKDGEPVIKDDNKNEEEQSEEKMKESLLSTTSENETKTEEKYVKALDNININIPSKQLTMIVGDIGCGKSSLLYAILNEMTPDKEVQPKVVVNGSIAYSAQKPWIMSATLKENIVFNQIEDKKRLDEAIHYSGLKDDLKILPNGLETEIGEKGTNLSGGQKARVSLARALYSNKDIYLLDDILSAVDVHVGKFLVEETILKYLKGKTVIMPTHAIAYLNQADNVIVMKKGKITTFGPPNKVEDNEDFDELMKVEKKKSEQAVVEKASKEE